MITAILEIDNEIPVIEPTRFFGMISVLIAAFNGSKLVFIIKPMPKKTHAKIGEDTIVVIAYEAAPTINTVINTRSYDLMRLLFLLNKKSVNLPAQIANIVPVIPIPANNRLISCGLRPTI